MSNARAKVYTLASLLDDLVAEHEAADLAIAEGRNLGPVIEFDRLRDELGGWWDGVTAMHAGPGAGKSAFAIQAAMHAECPAIYLTCEMSAQTVLRRMIANKSGEYLGKLRRGRIAAANIRRHAEQVVADHPHVGIIDATTAPCSPDLLRTCVEKMRAHGEHVFVVVDSVHALACGAYPDVDEYQAVSSAVEMLRGISAEYHVAALEIIERNRASMTSGGMHAGAATRKIEYSADAILALDGTGKVEVAGMGEAVGVNLTLQKNRNGRPGVTIGYAFEGATQRFLETGPEWPELDVVREIGKATRRSRREMPECEDEAS